MFIFPPLFLAFSACSDSTPVNIVSDFQQDSKQVIAEILKIDDPLLQESQILELIEAFPLQSKELCQYIHSDAGRGKCKRFQERPHLWSVTTDNNFFWEEGMFFERVSFPKLQKKQVVKKIQSK